MERKRRTILWSGSVYFQDEANKIGCGWRIVELVKIGWKWALLCERATGIAFRLKRPVWDMLQRHADKRSKSVGESRKQDVQSHLHEQTGEATQKDLSTSSGKENSKREGATKKTRKRRRVRKS